MREARRSDDDALFTELIATRMLMLNLLKPLILGKQVSQDWISRGDGGGAPEKRKVAQRPDAAIHGRNSRRTVTWQPNGEEKRRSSGLRMFR